MERTVFAHPDFQREAQRFVLLRVDLTDQSRLHLSEADAKELDKYNPTTNGALPLPTVLFINSKGKELRGLRVLGAESVGEFVKRMKYVS